MVETAFALLALSAAIVFSVKNFSSRAGGVGPARFAVSVLALNCFTGPVFTFAAGIYAVVLYFAAPIVRPKVIAARALEPLRPEPRESTLYRQNTAHVAENGLG